MTSSAYSSRYKIISKGASLQVFHPNPDKPEPERHQPRMNTDAILNLKSLFMFFKYRKFFAFIRVNPCASMADNGFSGIHFPISVCNFMPRMAETSQVMICLKLKVAYNLKKRLTPKKC
jgi:hypothetical protein